MTESSRTRSRAQDWERPELEGEGVIDIDRLSADVEIASDTRMLVGRWAVFFALVAIVSSLFHFYTAGFRPLPAMEQRPIHIAFMLFLCFLVYPATKGGRLSQPSALDLMLAFGGAITSGYVAWTYDAIVARGGFPTDLDIWFGTAFCLIVLEAARRTMGWFLVVLAAMALSTGAGIRWGVSSMVTPPPDDPGMEMMVDSGEGA